MFQKKRKYANVNDRSWIETILGASNSLMNQREIEPYMPDWELPSNHIHTSKYTWYNFVPKNLWEQFKKLPNIYFLIIGIFQILPYTSNTDNVPTIYIPLFLIIFMTSIRDLYEDCKRQVSDKKQNGLIYSQILENGQAVPITSSDIFPGMVIRINQNQMIPTDGLIVYSPSQNVYCNTKNLDGQSNLKKKVFLPELSQRTNIENINKIDVMLPEFKIKYQKPNTILNLFRGNILFRQKIFNLNQSHVCLRSSYLANTKYIYLLCLYTGHDTKILMSMNSSRTKRTNLQRKMYYLIAAIALIVFLISISFSLVTRQSSFRLDYYKFGQKGAPEWQIVTDSFTWILNITNLIPISLIFTIQTVKFLQSKLIQYDKQMNTDQFSTIVNNSSIIEQLGQIEYIASDKTGTLTKNKLTLKKISDGDRTYTQKSQFIPDKINLFMMIAHQVEVNQGQYQGVSLDEISILDFYKKYGNLILQRSVKKMKLQINKQIIFIQILNIIEFTSQRKRQTIIIKIQDQYYVICKGADEVLLQKMEYLDYQRQIECLSQSAMKFSKQGLRTLVYGYKQISQVEILPLLQEYQLCKVNGNSINSCINRIESSLIPLCCIGIEDQLADNLHVIIDKILNAGMKFMIISGDKSQTVMSIAKSLSRNVEPILAPTNEYKQEFKDNPFMVFSRCTPKQKQTIVQKIQGRVLAIGDGANDVSMLIRAHVGVGICGKQGRAAVQSADFGIPSFTHLDKLLFYYGVMYNRNNCMLVRYSFYKNFLFTLPLIIFSYYSFSSGVYLYNSYIAQLFNLLFTSIPIGAYSLFQQPISSLDQTKQPKFYKSNRQNSLFAIQNIILDFLQSLTQSIVCSYFCFQVLPSIFGSTNDLNIYQISSILMYFIVIISNIYLLMKAKKIFIGLVLSIIFGICAFILSYRIITQSGKYQIIKQSFNIISKPVNSFILVIIIVFGVILNIIVEGLTRLVQILGGINNSIKQQIIQVTSTNIKVQSSGTDLVK